MHDLSMMAATEWARANAPMVRDPIRFGGEVALAYCACREARLHAGDEVAMAAALASLSVRPEVLQAIALLASLDPVRSEQQPQTDLAGTE